MTDAPENQRLLKSMKALARTRSERSRKAMYMALLRAELYVPTEASMGGRDEDVFAQDDPLHGNPVYVAFTSLEALRQWRPAEGSFTKMDGMTFFPILSESKAASVLLNPKGELGGELYRNEILVLAEAVPQLKSWLES